MIVESILLVASGALIAFLTVHIRAARKPESNSVGVTLANWEMLGIEGGAKRRQSGYSHSRKHSQSSSK